jgi:gas vesicle protein
MTNERGDAAAYLGWFVLGAVAGAAAALLIAPKTGREAREYIAGQGSEAWRKAQEAAGEAGVKAGDLFDKGRGYFEEQTQRLLSAFEAGKSAMKEEMRQESTQG